MKRKVKFTEDVKVKDHTGAVTFEAEAGEVKELDAPSATRWVRRNKAEYDVDKPAEKPAEKPAKPKAPKDKGDGSKKPADDESDAKA